MKYLTCRLDHETPLFKFLQWFSFAFRIIARLLTTVLGKDLFAFISFDLGFISLDESTTPCDMVDPGNKVQFNEILFINNPVSSSW